MANEITQSINLSASKGGATVSISTSKRINMTGDDMLQGTQVIGTSAETLALGEISGAPGNLAIKNLDATNFVEIGGDSGLTVFKIKIAPGEACIFQPTSATLYAQANTAAVRVSVIAIEA
jgi:hypothetical protein